MLELAAEAQQAGTAAAGSSTSAGGDSGAANHSEARGSEGSVAAPDLRVELDVETWRELNRGTLTAPEALLRRRLKLHGDFVLGLKLHLILA